MQFFELLFSAHATTTAPKSAAPAACSCSRPLATWSARSCTCSANTSILSCPVRCQSPRRHGGFTHVCRRRVSSSTKRLTICSSLACCPSAPRSRTARPHDARGPPLAHRPRLTGAARRQKDERVRLTRLYDRGNGHDPAARPPLRGLRLRKRRHRLRSAGLVVRSREKR